MLGIRIEITKIDDDKAGEAWQDIVDGPAESISYVRMPGFSQSGPCDFCAQFFGMEHDGTGANVPLIPLHPNCVCIDVPKQLATALRGGNSPKTFNRFEWIERGPGKDMQDKILGKGKASLLSRGVVKITELYRKGGAAVALSVPLQEVSASLARKKSKAELVKAAKKAGIKNADKLSRSNIIKEISKA